MGDCRRRRFPDDDELGTAASENLNIKIAIINDGYLGMVKQWQNLFYGKRLSAVTLADPNFLTIAKAYNIPARRVQNWTEAVRAVKWARRINGPVLLDFHVNPNQHVYPMVASGTALGSQVLNYE